jgi:hypothetical protein
VNGAGLKTYSNDIKSGRLGQCSDGAPKRGGLIDEISRISQG